MTHFNIPDAINTLEYAQKVVRVLLIFAKDSEATDVYNNTLEQIEQASREMNELKKAYDDIVVRDWVKRLILAGYIFSEAHFFLILMSHDIQERDNAISIEIDMYEKRLEQMRTDIMNMVSNPVVFSKLQGLMDFKKYA
jgi:hypothetical protein